MADEPGPELIATATRRTFELDRVVEGTARRETDQGNKVQITLSTDVLFAFDKADLTAAAQAELRRVAGRLAEAKGDRAGGRPHRRRRQRQLQPGPVAAPRAGGAAGARPDGGGRARALPGAGTPAGNQAGFEGQSYFSGEFFWLLGSDASADRHYAVKTVGGIPYRFCSCSLIHTTVSKDTLPPGGQVRLFALLAAPPDAPTIDLQAPGFGGPIRDVPLI